MKLILNELYYQAFFAITSGIVLSAVFLFWQKSSIVIFNFEGIVVLILRLIFIFSVAGMFWGLYSLGKFDALGVVHLLKEMKNKRVVQEKEVTLLIRGPYRYVRHPLYIGWFTVIWVAPVMTVSHLAFAIMSTIYILKAIQWEESDLEQALPEYRRYKAVTPMLFPQIGSKPVTVNTVGSDA